jgi:SNF2 family DNA or RNA helicase
MSNDDVYSWPRDRSLIAAPFAHQQQTTLFMAVNPRGYVLNDIGTGKTMSALWAADFLMEMGVAKRALIIAPLSTLERVWGDAAFIHFKHRKFKVLHGSAERRRKLLAEPADFYIINHDGVGVIVKELAARQDIDIVIIDELAVYRNRQTAKWKAMNEVLYPTKGKPKPWVWGLTGAPIPQSPEDAYGQCRLVTPTTVPKFFTMWRNMTMDHQSTYV